MKAMSNYLLLWFLIASCQAQTAPTFDKLVYHYQDASVEASFHRSYTIEIWANGQAKLSVEVYGDTLAQQDFQVSEAHLKTLQSLLPTLEPAVKKLSQAAGVSVQSIQLFRERKKTYHLLWDSEFEAKPMTKDFVKLIHIVTPMLDSLLATPHTTASDAEEMQAKALALKAELLKNTSPKREKEILHELWLLTRNDEMPEEGAIPQHISLSISIVDKQGKDVHINQRQQGHTVLITLRGEREENETWEVEITHQLLDMDNLSELMYE